MESAVAVQANGVALAFQWSVKRSMRRINSEGAASNGALGDDVEPDLDLVEPGSVGRREMDVETRMFGQPHFDLGVLVGPVVVDDDVEL